MKNETQQNNSNGLNGSNVSNRKPIKQIKPIKPKRIKIMNKQIGSIEKWFWGIWTITCTLLFALSNAQAADSVCAEVQIEIRQEVTIERQAFDAHMRINNGLATMDLTDVSVELKFMDENQNIVPVTYKPKYDPEVDIYNPDDPNSPRFWVGLDTDTTTITSTSATEVTGVTVAASTSADIHWLIIPTQYSALNNPSGTLNYVGATLTYMLGGEPQTVEVTPDYIFVKPTPLLTFDYFLPIQVYGDDPETGTGDNPIVEPSIPFSLGLRVRNDGYGTAWNTRIESAQPVITTNEIGLLVNFVIQGSEVNGQPESPTLLVNMGNISPSESALARWIMTSSLTGEFTELESSFTHADDLGGETTSLIKETVDHFLAGDVLIDLPGSDKIRDFLGTIDTTDPLKGC